MGSPTTMKSKNGVRIEYVAMTTLSKWPDNPREHDIEAITDAIRRHGFRDPLEFDEKSARLVAGHGRIEACRVLWSEYKAKGEPAPRFIEEKDGEWFLPVVRGMDFEDEGEAASYVLASNRTTQRGGYNKELLSRMLQKVEKTKLGLQGSAFTPADLSALTARAKQTVEKMSGMIDASPKEATETEVKKVEKAPKAERAPATVVEAIDPGEVKPITFYVPAADHPTIMQRLKKVEKDNGFSTITDVLGFLLDNYAEEEEDGGD